MSDIEQATASPPVRTARWVRVMLILSLALNLLVLGIVAGGMIRHERLGMRPPGQIGFGPFSQAFAPEDRKALREAFVARAPDIRAIRRDERRYLEAVIDAVRADVLDEAALRVALDGMRGRMEMMAETGRDLMIARLADMSPEARRAFADRLERSLDGRRGGP